MTENTWIFWVFIVTRSIFGMYRESGTQFYFIYLFILIFITWSWISETWSEVMHHRLEIGKGIGMAHSEWCMIINGTLMLYASTRVTFHSVLRHSRHLSVIPVMPPSPLSLYFTYRSLSSFIVSPSFVFRLFLRYGSIPPLSCSEHHFSDLWLHYHTLTSSYSCGWTISLLSSWSYDFIT